MRRSNLVGPPQTQHSDQVLKLSENSHLISELWTFTQVLKYLHAIIKYYAKNNKQQNRTEFAIILSVSVQNSNVHVCKQHVSWSPPPPPPHHTLRNLLANLVKTNKWYTFHGGHCLVGSVLDRACTHTHTHTHSLSLCLSYHKNHSPFLREVSEVQPVLPQGRVTRRKQIPL